MYRLHTEEVQIFTRFTLLRAAGPRWWKKRRDWTKVCNRLVLWVTWPWQCIHGLATTASAIKGSSADIATVQTIAAERYINIRWKQFALFTVRICTFGYLYSTWTWWVVDQVRRWISMTASWHHFLSSSNIILEIQNHSTIVAVYKSLTTQLLNQFQLDEARYSLNCWFGI